MVSVVLHPREPNPHRRRQQGCAVVRGKRTVAQFRATICVARVRLSGLVMQLEKKFSTIEELTADKHTANRLFASFIGLGAVMLRVRHATLSYPPIDHLLATIPILVYQDVLFCFVLSWLFHSLLLLRLGRAADRTMLVVGWSFCFLLVLYTAVNSIVYENLHIH